MNKTIIIAGATGFIGRKLCVELFLKGYKLKILCRSIEKAEKIIPLPVEFILWNGIDKLTSNVFEGAFGVINLIGESVAHGRWTNERKTKILESRTKTTKIIADAINHCKSPPKVIVGASAIGIYGNKHNTILTEESAYGGGYLANVCKEWESSYSDFKGRLVLLRTGIVLGHGGALEKMLLPFRLGLGGKLGNGKQWMSWIHIDDLIKMYIFSMENTFVTGPINAVAPSPVINSDFTKTLSNVLNIPAILPVPTISLKIIFGEMSSILLDSQRVIPVKISHLNFKFSYSGLELALKSLLHPYGNKGCHVFSSYQWLPNEKEEVFSFFSKAENLEMITPPWLNFKIEKKSDDEIKQGTVIDYKLKIKGIPASWKTLISNWAPPNIFTDSQEKGPYSKWIHTHKFVDIQDGTLMTDDVVYKVPFGPMGHIVKELLIEKDITKIFEYRNNKIKELF